ncbi:YdiU family protein [Actinoplanes oblitus]|uniref:Protein nucleotidyltransferase YdiU n=1 Tax=Actinoplanes oblitus TaxID=3040509 RepID=A0ABY8WPU6_9ACTN|nr:YdiU family protein [Actinoplanes oblitus]WIM99452.1 YdiU family protein [Actinoplanes oblitus]
MDVSAPAVSLTHRFADELPELAIAWRAEECPEPRLLIADQALAAELGLAPEQLTTGLLTGTEPPAGARPVAQAYAGHQFGGYSPRLGDGRALLLGELDGRDLHLKGSGRTPFARAGDGLAAVGPMLREFVVSRAMHALGIPTTRSLAVVATGRTVHREQPLPGAVLARVAASHLRVGTFQFARATGDTGLLRRLADHAVSRHYPGDEGDYLGFFDSVVAAQASLVARWMLVGFVHGVMNTDNMTISGETIDYGPCAFMEAVDPATVYSSIDTGGRYAYGNQPAIAQWNLARFAEALLPLFHDDQEQAIPLAVRSLERFGGLFDAAWTAGMREKLGLSADADDAGPDDTLLADLAALLRDARVDYTTFFRTLSRAAGGEAEPARALFPDPSAFDSWLPRWSALSPDAALMDRVNPVYIPRNHLVEEALAAATDGDLSPVERLVEVVSDPFRERPGLARYAEPAPGDFGPYRTFCGT